MSAPEPRENPHLFGHEAAQATFRAALASGRLHHAWLLTGDFGIGKATLAYRLARAVLAGAATLDVPPTSPVFRRVAAGTHADLLTVERAWDDKKKRERTEIVVDDVRTIAGFLRLTPAEAGWRVVVVDGAEHLNRNAGNAMLKLLEEPPARAIMLLTCAAPGRLLPTVRSRCRQLRLDPLDAPEMEHALALLAPTADAAERNHLAALAEGSPGRALGLLEEQGVALASLVEDLLSALPRVGPERAHEVADRLARSEGGFTTFMDLLRHAVGAASRAAARGVPDPAQRRLAELRPLAEWSDVWQGLTRLQDETERFNLDKRQALVTGLALLNGS